MLYRNLKYPEAVEELSYVIKGGTLQDGTVLTALQLTDPLPRVPEYYFIYGLALARLQPPRCGEALPLAQEILAKLPGDEISVFNANEIIRLCGEAAQATPITGGSGTPDLLLTPGETAVVTPTP
jgi:hypothetical protein